jgi:hypothetical protein
MLSQGVESGGDGRVGGASLGYPASTRSPDVDRAESAAVTRGADKRVDRLMIAHLEPLNSRKKLAMIEVRPGDQVLRQQIDVAVDARRVVEKGLAEAIRAEFLKTRQARRLVKGRAVKARAITARRWF